MAFLEVRILGSRVEFNGQSVGGGCEWQMVSQLSTHADTDKFLSLLHCIIVVAMATAFRGFA